MIARSSDIFATRPGFCVGIVLTMPPFPYARPEVEGRSGFPSVR